MEVYLFLWMHYLDVWERAVQEQVEKHPIMEKNSSLTKIK